MRSRQRQRPAARDASRYERCAHRVRSPNGLWFQVLDQGTRAGNYEEASASLMIAYAHDEGRPPGVLADRHRRRGLQSLQACVDRVPHGSASCTGICGVAGLGNVPYRDGSYEYYMSEPVVANDPKGVGAFLMALSEGSTLAERAQGRELLGPDRRRSSRPACVRTAGCSAH